MPVFADAGALLVVSLLSLLSANPLFQKDGVLVEQTDDARTVSGAWQVIVILHPPPPPELTSWREQIETLIDSNLTWGIANDEKALWKAKIMRMFWSSKVNFMDTHDLTGSSSAESSDPQTNGTQRRHKRGLINFIGHVFHDLFGTGLDSDVHEIKSIMKEIQGNNQRLYHNQNKLMSVVNQTRHFVDRNTRGIQELFDTTGHLQKIVDYNLNLTTLLRRDLQDLQLMRYIDQNLQLMSEVFREWRLQWQLWHRQKLQMERGYLTEDILMPRYLGHILTEIERLHYGTLSTDWYYRHVQIAPVLFSESSMVYRASIPMLSMDRFLVYGLRYYPVPMKNGYSRKVLGKDTVAIESSDGSWFYPESSVCVGGQPMVCQPDILYLENGCETCLLEGRDVKCDFELTPIGNKSLDVFRQAVTDAEVIVVSYGGETAVDLRCLNHPLRTYTLRGLKRFLLPFNCTLMTSAWKIDALHHFNSNVSLEFHKILQLPSISFSWPKKLDTVDLGKPIDRKMVINWDELPKLNPPVNWDFEPEGWWDFNKWYVYAAILSVIFLILGVVYCWKGARPITFTHTLRLRRKKAGSLKKAVKSGDALMENNALIELPVITPAQGPNVNNGDEGACGGQIDDVGSGIALPAPSSASAVPKWSTLYKFKAPSAKTLDETTA